MSDAPPPWDPRAGQSAWSRAEVVADRAAEVHPGWGHPDPLAQIQPAPEAWASIPESSLALTDHPYAGFWRRFWGVYVDVWAVNGWLILANLVLVPIVWLLIPAAANCDSPWECDLPTSVVWGLPIVNALVNLVILYRLIPRRLGMEGATVGMHQLGLQLSDLETGGVLGPSTAVVRTVVAGALQLVPLLVVGFLVWHAGGDDGALMITELAVGVGVVTFLFLAPTLWSLIDPRRQTLYDRIAGSVVREVRPVSWLAVAAFAFTFGVSLPPVGIVLGHLARAQIHREHGHLAGRGLATASLVVGYLSLAALAVLAVVALA